MTLRSTVSILASALVLASPISAKPVNFDEGIDARAALAAARAQPSGIWTQIDEKQVWLAPGQNESAEVTLVSTAYRQVCEPTSPWTGPVCRDEIMFRETRRLKLVTAEPLPAEWGAQGFLLRLDVLRRPSLRIEALDPRRAYTYKLPEIGENILVVRPLAAPLP